TQAEFVASLRDFQPDVILSDHSLPQFNSAEALKICRRAGLQIPFILVTGTVSEEFAVTCLKMGADDYVLKANLTRLPSAIATALKKREEEKKRKIAEKALRQQNEELIKINRELDHFVYSTSHNLRAPLMSVLGLLNIAQKDLSENETRHFLDYFRMMNESIGKLDETLKEIIDYSKNARIEILNEPVNIRELLTECFEKLNYLDSAEGVEMKIDIQDKNSELIYSDPYRLTVIFTNILSNAIKYRDMVKPKSTIQVEVVNDTTKIIVSVKDNGVGIHDQYLSHIFEMFYRASEKSNGAGLGLYIAKETIGNLGGAISVESTLHEGTTFKIEIPDYSVPSL
ncbi:MAG TPA: hybrid sensor histidine kinase/response regulator, partial [Cyclobacteriaceae bacterium]|nr:hybrid sensor histidine kinase/response regulator [Cyclobacteriaceae bacterium]